MLNIRFYSSKLKKVQFKSKLPIKFKKLIDYLENIRKLKLYIILT